MQTGSKLILYGFDPISGTLRPVGTTDSGQVLFAGFANSGEGQDANIAADYVTGNASGEEIITASAVPSITLYSNPIKTNHATSMILSCYLSQTVAVGAVYTLGVEAIEMVTGQTNYRRLAFGSGPTFPTFTDLPGWGDCTAMVTRNDLTTAGTIHLSKTILPPCIRLCLDVPNRAGTTAGYWHYSLCR